MRLCPALIGQGCRRVMPISPGIMCVVYAYTNETGMEEGIGTGQSKDRAREGSTERGKVHYKAEVPKNTGP